MNQIRVVVTGLGAVTPLGIGVDEYWHGLKNGINGIGPITLFDSANFPVKVAGEVKGFEPTRYLDEKRADRAGRCAQFALTAAFEAMYHAKLEMKYENPLRVGVVVGTAGMPELLAEQLEVVKTRGAMRIDPLIVSRYRASMVPAHIGLAIGAKGVNTSINSACNSGNDALGIALQFLRQGQVDVILAGASGTNITALAIAATNRIGALSREVDPEKACRPFDLARSGFVYGEGAGILILETLEHAWKRKASILAELAGAGWSFDAFSETSCEIGERPAVMLSALSDAGVSTEEVDYINAHGTGTRLNDIAETGAIKEVFGEKAYRIPISSNKSMVGHLGCASGAIEAVASVLTIKEGVIPPTIHYETPDPECDLDYVPKVARMVPVNVVLSNSFGLGGHNCSLIFKGFQE
jgi:3-oxoacyl-[acyl-carrier-protein] synthase II